MDNGGFLFEKMAQEEHGMGEIARQWLCSIKLRVRESSYVKYSNIVKNHIVPELGECTMRELTTLRVEEFVAGKLKNGKVVRQGGLSEKSVKDILGVLKEIAAYAVHQNIEFPCRFEHIRMRVRDPEILLLGEAEQRRLAEFLQEDDDPKKTGILISLYMGLRLGEVCALRVENIFLENEILQVRHTMQRIQDFDRESGKRTRVIVTEPKSQSSRRDIPIPAFLMERLKSYQTYAGTAYVLTGRDDVYIEPRNLENVFQRYLRICEISPVKYHVLRHTFATRCIEAGFDAKTLSEILGHSSVNITLNRYVHSSMEQKRRSMAMVRV